MTRMNEISIAGKMSSHYHSCFAFGPTCMVEDHHRPVYLVVTLSVGLPYVRVSPDTSSFSAPVRASGRFFRNVRVLSGILINPSQIAQNHGFWPSFFYKSVPV